MWSIGAFFLGIVLLAIVLLVPVMQRMFMVADLSWLQIGCIAGLACLPTVVIQVIRKIKEIMK